MFQGLSPQRAEIIVAGGQILEGAMRALGINALRTCEWALREGVIVDHLREWEDESRSPLTDFADQKLRGVDAVGRRFEYEVGHAHQVARLAGKIFDFLMPVEPLTEHHRTRYCSQGRCYTTSVITSQASLTTSILVT